MSAILKFLLYIPKIIAANTLTKKSKDMLRSEIMGTFEGQNLKYMYAYKKSQFSFPVILCWV